MLKGLVFNLQTFTSEAFALFIDKFLNGRSGVAQGCELSNTNNSVTIANGYFVIRGRFLQIIDGVTVDNIATDGFYSLICEIDLSKINTTEQLNQAEIKVISNTSSYPTLVKQDITNEGTVYQYEFARFKVEGGTISNFIDRRTYVNFQSIYDQIDSEAQTVLTDIRNALAIIEDQSNVMLKTGGTADGDFTFNGTVTSDNIKNSDGAKVIYNDRFAIVEGVIITPGKGATYLTGVAKVDYPQGFNQTNCMVISIMGGSFRDNALLSTPMCNEDDNGYVRGVAGLVASLTNSNISVSVRKLETSQESVTIPFKIILMKID